MTRRSPLSLVAAVALIAPLPAAAQAGGGPTSPLTLGAAARIAAQRGTTAVTARERAIQRAALSVQNRAELLPSLSTDALIDGGTDSPIRTGAPGSGMVVPDYERTLDMRIKVTQRLFDPAAMGRWKASRSDADAAMQSARSAAESSAEEGARAYLAVLDARAGLDARVADSALAAELLEMARQQLAAGTAIALDVTRAESQLASAVSRLITGRSALARAGLELLRVLAMPADTKLALVDSLRPPEDRDFNVTTDVAVRTALSRRGDVLSAESATIAAGRQVGAIRSERLPSISLFGQAGSNANGALDSHTYGLQVSLPLFDGFQREARVAEARARQREADAQWQDSKRRAEVEVRSALLDLSAARDRVAAARVQLGLAEREVAQARERFERGVASNADVITASLTLVSARDVVVGALTAYHVARVSVAGAQGAATRLP